MLYRSINLAFRDLHIQAHTSPQPLLKLSIPHFAFEYTPTFLEPNRYLLCL
jgi:hypothetical protein